ncbi:hypothetical protein AWB65_05956 [Caballeronia humi]|uniref:Uncharacterized protein n=1 Tax=Caballeronia humi TaxID=326474 RepID=A0A158J6C7_9BURK|nr:hypothetical protein AWB65_05956 [Caballeronia humi]
MDMCVITHAPTRATDVILARSFDISLRKSRRSVGHAAPQGRRSSSYRTIHATSASEIRLCLVPRAPALSGKY